MALIADEFLGQYSLSKTLKFELVPQGKTKDLIKNLDDSILAIDAKRAAEYKNVKKILDDYYRFFIEQVLVKNILEESEVEEAYIAFQQRAKDSKAFEKSQDNMRKKIAKALKDGRSGSQLDAYEKLFKTDDKSELYKWLNYTLTQSQSHDAGRASTPEKNLTAREFYPPEMYRTCRGFAA